MIGSGEKHSHDKKDVVQHLYMATQSPMCLHKLRECALCRIYVRPEAHPIVKTI